MAKKEQDKNLQNVRRLYTASEKQQIIHDLEQGVMTAQEIVARFNIHERTLDSWIVSYAKDANFSFRRKRVPKSTRRQIVTQIRNSVISLHEAAKQLRIRTETIQNWQTEFPASNNLRGKNSQLMVEGDESVRQQIEEMQLKLLL